MTAGTASGAANSGPSEDSRSRRPLVISLHGIRTRASWQQRLSGFLEERGFEPLAFSYGYYSVVPFLVSDQRDLVDAFAESYAAVTRERKLNLDDPAQRPSIICHSLGTLIVGRALQTYASIRFDKVILCGSILPRDYDWMVVFQRGQVDTVRHEIGGMDIWSTAARLFKRGAGDSGRQGFSRPIPSLEEHRFDYFDHGSFFREVHMTGSWLPFLKRPPSVFELMHSGGVSNTPWGVSGTAWLDMAERQVSDLVDAERLLHPDYRKPCASSQQALDWMQINGDIFTYIFERFEFGLCGYLCVIPLERECLEAVLAGERPPESIGPDDVRPFGRDEVLDLYVVALVVKTGLAGLGKGIPNSAITAITGALAWRLRRLAHERGIAFDLVGTVAGSPVSRRLCMLLGMKDVGADVDGLGPRFRLSLQEPLPPTAEDVVPGIGLLKVASDTNLERLRQRGD